MNVWVLDSEGYLLAIYKARPTVDQLEKFMDRDSAVVLSQRGWVIDDEGETYGVIERSVE